MALVVAFDIEFYNLVLHHVEVFASIIIKHIAIQCNHKFLCIRKKDKYKQHLTFYQVLSLIESVRGGRRSELELDEDIRLLLNTDLKLMEILALHIVMAWRLSTDDITGLKEKKSLKNSHDILEERMLHEVSF